jgi:hypothetical protein
MHKILIALSVAAALTAAGCGNSSDAAKASGHSRLYDTQRDALEKARQVNNTVLQANQARTSQEDKSQ